MKVAEETEFTWESKTKLSHDCILLRLDFLQVGQQVIRKSIEKVHSDFLSTVVLNGKYTHITG